MQEANVPTLLRRAATESLELPVDLEIDEASYFLSTIEICVGDALGMTRWRKRVFVATSQITADAAEYFGLPRDRTVITGTRIDL
jgi:KUP system potassium uptake protein